MIPIINEDVVLAKDSHVVARLVSKNTPYHNQFWLYQPENKMLFDSIQGNVGKSFEVGTFRPDTRLVFALQAQDGNMYYTDSSLNGDGKAHVIKLPWGPPNASFAGRISMVSRTGITTTWWWRSP